jgi:hypothetical protein
MDELNETVSTMSLNESKDSEMIENFNQNVSTFSNLSLDENQESKDISENVIQNRVAGIGNDGKPLGSPEFDDFMKNLPIKFPVPSKVPQLLRRKKAKSN